MGAIRAGYWALPDGFDIEKLVDNIVEEVVFTEKQEPTDGQTITQGMWNELVVDLERIHGVKSGTNADAISRVLVTLGIKVVPKPLFPDVSSGTWEYLNSNIKADGRRIACVTAVGTSADGQCMAQSKNMAEKLREVWLLLDGSGIESVSGLSASIRSLLEEAGADLE